VLYLETFSISNCYVFFFALPGSAILRCSSANTPEGVTAAAIVDLGKLDSKLISEIEHFFVSYNDPRGKIQAQRKGPAVAKRLIRNQTKKPK
jgi:hypothetical protein